MEKNLFLGKAGISRIFKDKSILSPHFLPTNLPYRDKQIREIVGLLSPALDKIKPNNLFIYGKTGVGKTIVIKRVIRDLLEVCGNENSPAHVIYINCKNNNTKYRVLVKILKELEEHDEEYFVKKGVKVHEVGMSPGVIYDRIIEFIKEKELGLILVLDEVDAVRDLDDLLYTITRSNDDLERGFINLIGITNNMFFKRNLDPRSKSTLCEEELLFPPYNTKQLKAILDDRVVGGFKENTVPDDVTNYVAAVAAGEGGDARYALRLLQKTGELAEDKKLKKIKTSVVDEAKSATESDIVFEGLRTLPEHQRIVLYALANLSEQSQKTLIGEKRAQFISGEVYEEYKYSCRKLKENPRSVRWVREYLNDLDMLGFVSIHKSGKGTRGQTRLIALGEDPVKIINILNKTFGL